MNNSESILINITYNEDREPSKLIIKNLTRQIEVIANKNGFYRNKTDLQPGLQRQSWYCRCR